MLETLQRYLRSLKGREVDAFVASHPDPVFVVLPFSQRIEDTGVVTLVGEDLKPSLTAVGEIRKRAGANRFASMITVGRTKHNDIAIKASDVSKTHAYLVRDRDSIRLVDSGSTNGTFVQGRRLKPRKEKVSLASGDRVDFAKVKAIYYSPADFYTYLRDLEASLPG